MTFLIACVLVSFTGLLWSITATHITIMLCEHKVTCLPSFYIGHKRNTLSFLSFNELLFLAISSTRACDVSIQKAEKREARKKHFRRNLCQTWSVLWTQRSGSMAFLYWHLLVHTISFRSSFREGGSSLVFSFLSQHLASPSEVISRSVLKVKRQVKMSFLKKTINTELMTLLFSMFSKES